MANNSLLLESEDTESRVGKLVDGRYFSGDENF